MNERKKTRKGRRHGWGRCEITKNFVTVLFTFSLLAVTVEEILLFTFWFR